jgi:hypothetical protein
MYIKRLKKNLNNENIQKMFLQKNSHGFVVLKTYFSNHCVQGCGGEV